MHKARTIIKRLLKVISWVILATLLVLILIAVLIQIPSIQNKIIDKATSFISNKTNTRVEIDNISISFPGIIVIKGLFLDDLQQDTLLYAREAKVDMAFRNLLRNKIHISSFLLEDAVLNLSRIEADSLFNFNFLITAFSKTTSQKVSVPKEGTKWIIQIDKVGMTNIRLRFDDAYGGISASLDVKHLNLKMDQIDPTLSVYRIDELLVNGLIADVAISKQSESAESGNALPVISANIIRIEDTNIRYDNSIIKQSVVADINHLSLEDAAIDMEKQSVLSERILLSQSTIRYNTIDKAISSDISAPETITADGQGNWTVEIQRIDLDDNSISYTVANKPVKRNSFDINHLNYSNISLAATDIFYSAQNTRVSIKDFTAIDQNNFKIVSFATDFSMDDHSVTAKKLKVITNNSIIDADLNIRFSSLASLKDSLQTMVLDLDMRNINIKTADMVYFNNQLTKNEFFRNAGNVTSVSGRVSGPMNKLTGNNLVIKTGMNTLIETDFVIVGLPDAKSAVFNFPVLTVQSGKKDIEMMAGQQVPESIELPENVNLDVVFNGTIKEFQSTVAFGSSFGSGKFLGSIDKSENFSGEVVVDSFDLGRLLKDTLMYGPVSLTADASGQGLNKNTIKAKIKAEVTQFHYNQYVYQNLNLDGNIAGQAFTGTINLDDENAVFDFEGLVDMNPGQERYEFLLNVLGADLQKLNFAKDEIRIGFIASADLVGSDLRKLNGKAGVSKLIVSKGAEIYLLDSLMFASINETSNNELNFSSALIGIKYSGTVSPADLRAELLNFANRYFPFSDNSRLPVDGEPANFNFEIQLHNHPILSQVLLPKLNEFEPGIILGSFDGANNDLKINATVKKIVYGSIEVNDFLIDVNSNSTELNYKIFSSSLSNAQINLENLLVDGKMANDILNANLSSIGDDTSKKFVIHSQITKDIDNYTVFIEPEEFFLMYDPWEIASDNYIKIGKEGFLIHNMFLNNRSSEINIASVNNQFNDDLNIEIINFRLDDLSRIIEKDSLLVKGNVDGNILLKRENDTYGIIADAIISNLAMHEVPVGDISIKAENTTPGKFDIAVNLSGADNQLEAKGYYIPEGGNQSISINTDIQSLSMKTIEALLMGQISESSGALSGNILIQGAKNTPEITGELVFNDAFINPAVLNNRLEFKNETIQFKSDGIYLNAFTIRDVNQNTAILDGTVKMKQFKDLIFALQVSTSDFLLLNTTAKDNENYFGRMVVDSEIGINGPLSLPIVSGRLRMKRGSNFTFAVPEDELTTDRGEGVVEFIGITRLHPILDRGGRKENQSSGFKGVDLSTIVEVDKEATLRLLMDPTSNDSLVVRGEAALSFSIDRSGKMSLTGAYNLDEGSYLVSLESVVRRRFDIISGSTIIWNGDPLDALISINARYEVRAAPYDLVANQMTGMSDSESGSYKQRYPFWVLLKLRGDVLRPEIGFEIQLPPEERGILGGAVNQKLIMLNEDASALNKQVFALLVLGRFVQENPLQTESGGTSTLVRSTVSNFLSGQLNKWSSKVLPGVELNFDVQSYNDYQSGEAQGRTQVEVGIKKHLFNDRLSVELGGSVDVEGETARQNSASDITGDVTVEYKLTEDGRYRLRAFRHNQYEGAIEGQLIETGVGAVMVRDFDQWKEFFKAPKKEE